MSNVFQQWQFGGGRDWRPVLRGVLGNDVIGKHELLARNIFLYAGTGTVTVREVERNGRKGLEVIEHRQADEHAQQARAAGRLVPGDHPEAEQRAEGGDGGHDLVMAWKDDDGLSPDTEVHIFRLDGNHVIDQTQLSGVARPSNLFHWYWQP